MLLFLQAKIAARESYLAQLLIVYHDLLFIVPNALLEQLRSLNDMEVGAARKAKNVKEVRKCKLPPHDILIIHYLRERSIFPTAKVLNVPQIRQSRSKRVSCKQQSSGNCYLMIAVCMKL